MRPEDIRRWAEDRKAAELREHAALLVGPCLSATAGLDLILLASQLHGWPLPIEPADAAEDERVWRDWDRLRAAFRPA
jgi:hypothetical protein